MLRIHLLHKTERQSQEWSLFNSGVQMISIVHIYTESTKASILTGVACTTTLYTYCHDGKAKENHQPRKTLSLCTVLLATGPGRASRDQSTNSL